MVFRRDCGATTGFSTHVAIIPAGSSLPNDGGNALVLKDEVPLRLRWTSADALYVGGFGEAQSYVQQQAVAGVSIDYEP